MVQEAEFTDDITKAAEMACEKYSRDTVYVYSGSFGTLIFPDLETVCEAARAAALRFDLFSYQIGLNVDLRAIDGMVRDCCVPYYRNLGRE